MVRPRGIDEAVQGSAPVGGLVRNVIYLAFERVNASLVRTSRGHAIGAVNQHSIQGAKECRGRERRMRGQLRREVGSVSYSAAAEAETRPLGKQVDPNYTTS